MMKLLQEQMELTRIQAEERRKQTAKFAELVERLSGNAQQSTKLEKVEVSEASIIASLAERIPTFDFNLEDNRTFPKWYNRYSEMIKGLSEDGKRQLLLEKLSEPCYEQLVAALRPKRCIELSPSGKVETSEQSRKIGAGVGNKERYRRPGNAGTVVKQGISRRNVVNPLQNPKGRLAPVKGQWIDFQVDTGADITLIGRVEWEKLGKPTLETADAKVICANGSTMEIDGRFHTDLELKGSTGQGWIYVRKEGNLLGLDFINQSEHMAYHMERMVSQVESVKKDWAKELQTRFPTVFQEELGTCVKEKAHLEVKEGDEDIVIAEVKVLNVDYLAEGEATATDKVLKTVIKYWKSNNWPRSNQVDETIRPFITRKDDIAVTEGCVLWKHRVVIPELLRNQKSGYDAVQEFGNPSYDLIPVHNEDPTYISQQP
ncbi:unnamed protein product [Caenorhabditis bovis]|uniref:Peptidase A2 domain-containing protein n=1 Tax=Caenorhabditis bovis TaxID=2654633 RepID=A0A8S1FE95_9PELO|nr:unnamed protein product [Caenorhabditis bovis]